MPEQARKLAEAERELDILRQSLAFARLTFTDLACVAEGIARCHNAINDEERAKLLHVVEQARVELSRTPDHQDASLAAAAPELVALLDNLIKIAARRWRIVASDISRPSTMPAPSSPRSRAPRVPNRTPDIIRDRIAVELLGGNVFTHPMLETGAVWRNEHEEIEMEVDPFEPERLRVKRPSFAYCRTVRPQSRCSCGAMDIVWR